MRLALHEVPSAPLRVCNRKRLQHCGDARVHVRRYLQQSTFAAGRLPLIQATAQHSYEDRLLQLLDLEGDALRERAVDSTGAVDIGFLLWLASREEAATGAGKERLGTLASQLTALHEGLEPLPRGAVQEASAQLKRTEPLDQDGLVQLGARWRALTKDSAAAALSPEAAQLAERQVSQLGAGVKDSKATSAVELMGRKRLGQGESLPLGPADPASRILEALLAVDDERERLALLPSAFEPHPEGELPLEDPDGVEPLHTSPASLLQAINFSLSRMEPDLRADIPRVLRGESGPGPRDSRSRLLGLRAEVFRIWDGVMPDE